MFYISKLTENDIFLDIKEKDFKGVLFYILNNPKLSKRKEIFDAIIARESIGTTAIGNNIALPHCRLKSNYPITVKFVLHKDGIKMNSLDSKKVNFLFFVIGPENEPNEYLKTLSMLAKVLNQKHIREQLLKSKAERDMLDIFSECEKQAQLKEA